MPARKDYAAHLDVALVRRLLTLQFPDWADLPIRPVEVDGWDNATFRLGDDMSVRLPSHEAYEPQVQKEHEWLPRLAPLLPLPIPVPLGLGVPSADFPMHWSVRRWLEGDVASVAPINDRVAFASALAAFLGALYRIDAADGPPAGGHSHFRGAPLTGRAFGRPPYDTFDAQVRSAIVVLGERIDADLCTEVWDAATRTPWGHAPLWIHGDVAADNLLVRDGRLGAVIDFGCSAVGDPACDLVIAWTFFSGESRDAFRSRLPLDEATWARGRGWALWKALIVLARAIDTASELEAASRHVVEEVLIDHVAIG